MIKRIVKKTIKSVRIEVAPNDNLGMLATVRDSLNQQQPATATSEKSNAPTLIWGIPWKVFAGITLIGLLGVYFLAKIILRLWKKISDRRHAYQQTEAYWFRKFTKSKGDQSVNLFYAWLGRLPGKPVAFQNYAMDKQLVTNWQNILAITPDTSDKEMADFKHSIHALRTNNALRKTPLTDNHQHTWED